MITCPVCEQQQADAAECVVCGRALGPAGAGVAAELAAPPLEGLEPTLQAGGAEVRVELLAELEPTLQASAGPVVAAPMAEFEATLAAPVEAPGELVPDLEPTAASSSDPRTELPLFPVCRYCRTEAGPGEKICGRCGMRLGALEPAAPAAGGAGPRLCSCGTPISRAICPACGARNQTG